MLNNSYEDTILVIGKETPLNFDLKQALIEPNPVKQVKETLNHPIMDESTRMVAKMMGVSESDILKHCSVPADSAFSKHDEEKLMEMMGISTEDIVKYS